MYFVLFIELKDSTDFHKTVLSKSEKFWLLFILFKIFFNFSSFQFLKLNHHCKFQLYCLKISHSFKFCIKYSLSSSDKSELLIIHWIFSDNSFKFHIFFSNLHSISVFLFWIFSNFFCKFSSIFSNLLISFLAFLFSHFSQILFNHKLHTFFIQSIVFHKNHLISLIFFNAFWEFSNDFIFLFLISVKFHIVSAICFSWKTIFWYSLLFHSFKYHIFAKILFSKLWNFSSNDVKIFVSLKLLQYNHILQSIWSKLKTLSQNFLKLFSKILFVLSESHKIFSQIFS